MKPKAFAAMAKPGRADAAAIAGCNTRAGGQSHPVMLSRFKIMRDPSRARSAVLSDSADGGGWLFGPGI